MQIVVSQNQNQNDTASNPNIVVDRNASNLNAIYQSPCQRWPIVKAVMGRVFISCQMVSRIEQQIHVPQVSCRLL